jgi:hypothetical protein
MEDSPRQPDPTASRGDAGTSGVEQTAETPDIRSSEEGGQPDSGADTADVEGAALGGVE